MSEGRKERESWREGGRAGWVGEWEREREGARGLQWTK